MDSVSIIMISPGIVVLLAYLILNEKITRKSIIANIIAFFGVVLIPIIIVASIQELVFGYSNPNYPHVGRKCPCGKSFL